ncbi:MAG: hypothetical protein IPG17_19480 [Sandaracinaceae bacterium]|nr:hypothetical protein [Sandaracinaceae bacterium]MBK7777623.1 hypothetical protein [Sandaracinaceae bacterium]
MIRAVLVGMLGWAALGAFGLPSGVASHAFAPDTQRAGLVSAPDAPDDTYVVEGRPLAWGAAAERSAPSVERRAGRCVALVGSWAHVAGRVAPVGCPHDTRSASRMSRSAERTVDVRREIFRTLPGRRAGGVEAASAPQPC